MWYAWGRAEMCTGLGVRKSKGKIYMEDLDLDGRVILKWI
jgi:hypothetical protein